MTEPGADISTWDTGLGSEVLKWVGAQSVKFPDSFNVHSHLKKHHIEGRIKKLEAGSGLDWGTAEALAIGSLLYQVHFFTLFHLFVATLCIICPDCQLFLG